MLKFFMLFFSEARTLTLLRAEGGSVNTSVFGMKESRLERQADIGMTGLWGRLCLSNDYYHRNLSLAVLNTALDFHLVLVSLPFSEQTGVETGEGLKELGHFLRVALKVNLDKSVTSKKEGSTLKDSFKNYFKEKEEKRERHVERLACFFSVEKEKKKTGREEVGMFKKCTEACWVLGGGYLYVRFL